MKRVLWIVAIVLVAVALGIVYFLRYPTNLDRPERLSNQTQTIEVTYIAWACDCANWLETKYYKNNSQYEVKDTDCIFIDPANPGLRVPELFWHSEGLPNTLRLTGQFYLDKGIPDSYEFDSEKPDKARVFRYSKIEIIQP